MTLSMGVLKPSNLPLWEHCRAYPTANRRFAKMGRGNNVHHRLYTGGRPDLQGKMALVVSSGHADIVFAQFDYANNGHLNLNDPLCHGWHRFPALAFKSKNLRGKR